MINFNDYSSLLMTFYHNLHNIDPWVIMDDNKEIFLHSHSCTELMCAHYNSITFSAGSSNKIELAMNSGLIVHNVDTIRANDREFTVWMCIEAITVAKRNKLNIIHMQLIENNSLFKSNVDSANKQNDLIKYTNLDVLDNTERQIADLLKAGYTQQAITKFLLTSRSSVVRKIHTICKKIGLANITSTAELRLHLKE